MPGPVQLMYRGLYNVVWSNVVVAWHWQTCGFHGYPDRKIKTFKINQLLCNDLKNVCNTDLITTLWVFSKQCWIFLLHANLIIRYRHKLHKLTYLISWCRFPDSISMYLKHCFHMMFRLRTVSFSNKL